MKRAFIAEDAVDFHRGPPGGSIAPEKESMLPSGIDQAPSSLLDQLEYLIHCEQPLQAARDVGGGGRLGDVVVGLGGHAVGMAVAG